MPAPKGHPPYLGCETGGRPPKYTKEFIDSEADAFLEWMNNENSLWYKDFALERGYLPDQLSEWAKVNEKFSRVYKHSQAWQQSKLIKGGLLNKYHAGFTKFVMSNTCGWKDKQEVSGGVANPLSFLLQKIDGNSKDLTNENH